MPRYQLLEDVPGNRLVLGARGDRRTIEFDRAHGASLVGRWPRRRMRIAIANIVRVRLIVAPDFFLELAIRHRSGHGMSEQRLRFAVRDLDLDTEALDLAFRIARILRLGGYIVRRESEDRRVIDLVAQAPSSTSPYRVAFPALRCIDELDGGAVQETPAIVAAAKYAASRAGFTEPETPVETLRVGERIVGLEVVAWDPPRLELAMPRSLTTGRAVRNALHGIGTTLGLLVLSALCVASSEGCRRFIGEGLDESGFYGIEDYLAFAVVGLGWIGLLVLAIMSPLAVIWAAIGVVRRVRSDLRYRAARRLTFDGAVVVIEVGARRRHVPRREIEGIVLRSYPWLATDTETWSELELMLDGEDELLAVTHHGPKLEQAALARVAIGLARVLDVPWRVE